MPTTIGVTVPEASSPHSFQLYLMGTGGAATKTRAEILANCAEGPLKALLARTPDWTVFNLGDVACNALHAREVINRSVNDPTPAAAGLVEFLWTSTGIKADCSGTRQLDIRLSHTSRL